MPVRSTMTQEIETIQIDALAAIAAVADEPSLEETRIAFPWAKKVVLQQPPRE